MLQGAAPGLGAGGRPGERSWLPESSDLAFGGTPSDHLNSPHRAREESVDLSLRSIAGQSPALHSEFFAEVHVHYLIGPLQMQHDRVGPAAATKDQL